MKIRNFLFTVLAIAILAVPASAVEIIGGAGVGHELGRPAGESFNVVWFGTVVKSWNSGDTKLSTVARYGKYEEANIDAFGGKVILSDLIWQSPTSVVNFKAIFDVGFMDKYQAQSDGSREVAPTVGGGLTMQISKVVAGWAYYEAFYAGPQWKQTLYFGLSASTAFSIGGAK